MKRIVITGAAGYIGSALFRHLERVERYQLAGIDNLRRGNPGCIPLSGTGEGEMLDYAWMHADQLGDASNRVDAIVHLAAHATVKECQDHPLEAFYNNLVHPVNLAVRLTQLYPADTLPTFIYASTGSLHSTGPFTSIYDVTKRALEDAMRQFYPSAIGLRFGTVCGASPNPRRTMLNAMVDDALEHGRITVQNPTVTRPILAMKDLCRAVEKMIENPIAGVHGLCSFSETIEHFATAVGKVTSAEVWRGVDGPVYDFDMPGRSARDSEEMLGNVLDDLIEAWHDRHRATRNVGETV